MDGEEPTARILDRLDPDASNDIMTLFHIFVAPGTNPGRSAQDGPGFSPESPLPHVVQQYARGVLRLRLDAKTKELRQLRESLDNCEGVQRIVPNIIYSGFIFETWRDRMIKEKGSPTVSA